MVVVCVCVCVCVWCVVEWWVWLSVLCVCVCGVWCVWCVVGWMRGMGKREREREAGEW